MDDDAIVAENTTYFSQLEGKIIMVPFKEYMDLLQSGKERDEALIRIEKARIKVTLVQKVLGRFLTTLNKQIPLDAYLESFNKSQEEVRFWMDRGSRIRLSFNTSTDGKNS